MTPKVKIFENVFPDSSKLRENKSLKLLKGRLDYRKKTRAPRDSSQPPIFPNGPITPKIPWRLSFLDL